MSWQQEAHALRERKPKHILFLCVANSARSQMAEGIARALAQASAAPTRISSAGSDPGVINPMAKRALAEIDIPSDAQFSKPISDIALETVDCVITLCAEEVCPVVPSRVATYHWGLPDPAAATGSEDQVLASFRAVRDELRARLEVVFGA